MVVSRPKIPGLPGPGFEFGKVVVSVGEFEGAALDPFDISAYFVGEAGPELLGKHDEGNLPRVPALLSDPAPGPGGLLTGDLALFDNDNVHALLGQVVGNATADDACTDDYYVGSWCRLADNVGLLQIDRPYI